MNRNAMGIHLEKFEEPGQNCGYQAGESSDCQPDMADKFKKQWTLANLEHMANNWNLENLDKLRTYWFPVIMEH